MQKKYSALIIGCGQMGCLNDASGSGNEHKTISYAKSLKYNGNFDVFYYDEDGSKVNKAIELWGGNYCNNNYVDVVIISTPDNTHYDILKNEYIGKPKLVICEKPLCSTVAEVKEIIKLYEKSNIPILLGYTRNFIPLYHNLKELNPIYGECYFNRGWLHTGTHAIALFEWLGIKNYNLTEVQCEDRIWHLRLKFEELQDFVETRIGDMPVPSYFDFHTRYVIDNAVNFLEGKEELRCTMYDGLKALEIMESLRS